MTPPPKDYCTHAQWLANAMKNCEIDKCLLWPWSRTEDGYGRVYLRKDGDEGEVKAHRLSFYLTHGRWPEPCALHTCDNPPCFNPKHIYEGDQKRNGEDKANRNRAASGERNGRSKLTEKIVMQARKEYAAGKSYTVLAKRYKVARNAMWLAVTGNTWRRVDGAVKP